MKQFPLFLNSFFASFKKSPLLLPVIIPEERTSLFSHPFVSRFSTISFVELQQSLSHSLAWKLRIPNIILGMLPFPLGPLQPYSCYIPGVDGGWFCSRTR